MWGWSENPPKKFDLIFEQPLMPIEHSVPTWKWAIEVLFIIIIIIRWFNGIVFPEPLTHIPNRSVRSIMKKLFFSREEFQSIEKVLFPLEKSSNSLDVCCGHKGELISQFAQTITHYTVARQTTNTAKSNKTGTF